MDQGTSSQSASLNVDTGSRGREVVEEDITSRPGFFGKVTRIWGREFDAYFRSPVAYVFVCMFLIASSASFLFVHGFFDRQEASLEFYFSDFRWLFMLLIPVLTMGLWAKERRTGTIEILLTLPVRTIEVVLGKFFAALSLLGVTLLFTLPVPIMVEVVTKPGQSLDFLSVFGSYIGTFLFGAALLSIGLYVSSFVRDQIVSVILTGAAVGIVTFMGHEILLDQLHGSGIQIIQNLVRLLEYLAFGTHLRKFAAGLFPLDSLVYFFSICALFLFLTNNNLRSWKYTE